MRFLRDRFCRTHRGKNASIRDPRRARCGPRERPAGRGPLNVLGTIDKTAEMSIVGSVMQKLPPVLPVPEVSESERTTLVQALLELIEALQQRDTALQEQNHALQEQVEALKQEVARLKGHSGKPNVQPSRLGREDKNKKKKRKKNKKPAPELGRFC